MSLAYWANSFFSTVDSNILFTFCIVVTVFSTTELLSYFLSKALCETIFLFTTLYSISELGYIPDVWANESRTNELMKVRIIYHRQSDRSSEQMMGIHICLQCGLSFHFCLISSNAHGYVLPFFFFFSGGDYWRNLKALCMRRELQLLYSLVTLWKTYF